MTVKRILGAGVLAFVVTAGGFVLPPTGDRLTPPTVVPPGATRTADVVEAGAEDMKPVNVQTVDGETPHRGSTGRSAPAAESR